MFLLGAVILTLTGNGEAENVSVELQTAFRMSDTDCRVINAKEESIFALPAGGALVLREPDEFEVVPIRVPEIKRPDARSSRDRVWQSLRRCADVLDVLFAQCCVGGIHIAHDDGKVLKPQVVAAAGRWNGIASGRRKELSQLDTLLPKSQRDNSHPCAEDPGGFLIGLA